MPVIARQVLGSSPVTLVLRPTMVPVTVWPSTVSLAPTFQGASWAAPESALAFGRRRPLGRDFFWPAAPFLLRCSRNALDRSRLFRFGLPARAVCAALTPFMPTPDLPRVEVASRRASDAARPTERLIACFAL